MIALAYNADLRPKTRRKKNVRHLQTTGYMSKYVYEPGKLIRREPGKRIRRDSEPLKEIRLEPGKRGDKAGTRTRETDKAGTKETDEAGARETNKARKATTTIYISARSLSRPPQSSSAN